MKREIGNVSKLVFSCIPDKVIRVLHLYLQILSHPCYRIRGNFRGLPIFAVFRGQYDSAKIKIAKYFPFSVKESSLEVTSIFAAVTRSFPLLR